MMAQKTAVMQEYNVDNVLRDLEKGRQDRKFSAAIRNHLRTYVPLIYVLDKPDPAREEKSLKKVVFTPLEAYILGTKDVADGFERLKGSVRSDLCGKVFKNGDATFSCRDCAVDTTCVLCIDCFQKSEHKQHRYKMFTSGGGGYCDCGDEEAWKESPRCSDHRAEPAPDPELPSDVKQRADLVCSSLVDYILELLTWTNCTEPPIDLAQHYKQDAAVWATILFNDEVHTYEQVIGGLQKAIGCTHQEAVDFATTVDREGRSSVLEGKYTDCSKAKDLISTNTQRLSGSKPLRAEVMRWDLVSHQNTAIKLIGWLQNLAQRAEGLRGMVLDVLSRVRGPEQPWPATSPLEQMMLHDVSFWKAVRTACHQLFMAVYLKDAETKKQIASVFVQHYKQLQRDYITDDHDHNMSVCSVSVQLFTVPSVAKYLIKEWDVILVVLETFLGTAREKVNIDGVFRFQRSERMPPPFRRALHMLWDLKYILIAAPEPGEWDEKLRENFLHGLDSLLSLLGYMQHMDAVTRQTGRHVEYEPEWENAFNMMLKLQPCVMMMMKWCASDPSVLRESLMRSLVALKDTETHSFIAEPLTVAGHCNDVIQYSVTQQGISVHLALTRFIPGLVLGVREHGLTLEDVGLKDLAREMMELPLRCIVMVSQVNAGLWRRNGYALLNQVYFYQNVRFRKEMMDRDIQMLQISAALLAPNDFFLHVLNKFGLSVWLSEEADGASMQAPKDGLKKLVAMAENFLLLLIHVLCERYVPGIGEVSEDSAVKREVIHQLCISPMPHSKLVQLLPEDTNHETGLEEVALEVADFKKKGSGGQGYYELKPEFYKEYNMYFYHYVRSDASKSEEAERKRKQAAGEDSALAPPLPPDFTECFKPVSKLLLCDVMMYIIKALSLRTVRGRQCICWSDVQLERMLFLVGVGIREDEKDPEFGFVEKLRESGALKSLIELVGHDNVTHQTAKDLLAWIAKRTQHASGAAHVEVKVTETSTSGGSAQQRARDKAKRKRDKVIKQMSRMQQAFIDSHPILLAPQASAGSTVVEMDTDSTPAPEAEGPAVAVGPARSAPSTASWSVDCILCQEGHQVSSEAPDLMVLAAYIQRSTVLRQCPGPEAGNQPALASSLLPHVSVPLGIHTSSCSHAMHVTCWQNYFDTVRQKEQRRGGRLRKASFDVNNGEFLCPLCECISNTVIPMLPHESCPPCPPAAAEQRDKCGSVSLSEWLSTCESAVEEGRRSSRSERKRRKDTGDAAAAASSSSVSPSKLEAGVAGEWSLLEPCPLSVIKKSASETLVKKLQQFQKIRPRPETKTEVKAVNMVRKLATDAYTNGLYTLADDTNPRVPAVTWATCAYTIKALEQRQRVEGQGVFEGLNKRDQETLAGLTRTAAAVTSRGFPGNLISRHALSFMAALLQPGECGCPSMLELDMFQLMVSLVLSLPGLFPQDKVMEPGSWVAPGVSRGEAAAAEEYAFRLALTAHVVQILLTRELPNEEPMETDAQSGGEAGGWAQAYRLVRSSAGLECGLPDEGLLRREMETAVRPFLRASALFFHFLSTVPPPPPHDEPKELGHLLQYLNLPSDLSSLVTDSAVQNLVARWCEDSRHLLKREDKLPSPCPPPSSLVALPNDYSELINKASAFSCPVSEQDDSRVPTLCLRCGELLCSQTYCCQRELEGQRVGAATAHAYSCGAGHGVFIRVRDCQVLLLCGKEKGCFQEAPYVDKYGETDPHLKRGNPLYLNKERYNRLCKMWLTHTVPEEIVHAQEANSTFTSIDWTHL